MPATIAFSYVRFSSVAQAEGDSLSRQTERAVEYCRRRGWSLDDTLTLRDLGVSAFRGKNAAVGNFRTFLDAIKGGRVAPGSVLLVESFDRISRQGIDEGYDLIKSILKAGVKIVTLSPEREFDRDATKSLSKGALEIQLILERAAEESERKSDRVGAAWAKKRRAAASGKPLTKRVPVWIRHAGDRLELDEKKVKVVKRLMRLAVDGVGLTGIAQRMSAEKVPVMGNRTYEGKTVVWSAAMVWKIITSRALLGEYQPCTGTRGHRKPDGPVVPDYYPRAVSDDEFAEVQAALRTRFQVGRGRPAKRVLLFAGLLKDARTGGTFVARHTSKREPTLAAVNATHGRGGKWSCFPLRPFEDGLLSELVEVKVEDVRPGESAVNRVKVLGARKAELENLIAKWKAKMNRAELVDVVAEKLAEFGAAHADTVAELTEAEREEGAGLAAAMAHLKTVAASLADDDSEENRLRCRAAIRAAVSSVVCLFMPGKGRRVGVAQVFFKGGAHRDYIISHRPAGRTQWTTWPASTEVKSFARAGLTCGDLRVPGEAEKLDRLLTKHLAKDDEGEPKGKRPRKK